MLTDTEWTEMYKLSVQNSTNIEGIKDELSRFRVEIKDCDGRVTELEKERSFTKGTVAYLAVSITVVLTVLSNAMLWAFGYLGGGK